MTTPEPTSRVPRKVAGLGRPPTRALPWVVLLVITCMVLWAKRAFGADTAAGVAVGLPEVTSWAREVTQGVIIGVLAWKPAMEKLRLREPPPTPLTREQIETLVTKAIDEKVDATNAAIRVHIAAEIAKEATEREAGHVRHRGAIQKLDAHIDGLAADAKAMERATALWREDLAGRLGAIIAKLDGLSSRGDS